MQQSEKLQTTPGKMSFIVVARTLSESLIVKCPHRRFTGLTLPCLPRFCNLPTKYNHTRTSEVFTSIHVAWMPRKGLQGRFWILIANLILFYYLDVKFWSSFIGDVQMFFKASCTWLRHGLEISDVGFAPASISRPVLLSLLCLSGGYSFNALVILSPVTPTGIKSPGCCFQWFLKIHKVHFNCLLVLIISADFWVKSTLALPVHRALGFTLFLLLLLVQHCPKHFIW